MYIHNLHVHRTMRHVIFFVIVILYTYSVWFLLQSALSDEIMSCSLIQLVRNAFSFLHFSVRFTGLILFRKTPPPNQTNDICYFVGILRVRSSFFVLFPFRLLSTLIIILNMLLQVLVFEKSFVWRKRLNFSEIIKQLFGPTNRTYAQKY